MRPGLAGPSPRVPFPSFREKLGLPLALLSGSLLAPAPRAPWLSIKDTGQERLLCPSGWTHTCLVASVAAFGPQVWPPPFLIRGTDEALCFVRSLYGSQRSYMDDVSFHLHGRLGR